MLTIIAKPESKQEESVTMRCVERIASFDFHVVKQVWLQIVGCFIKMIQLSDTLKNAAPLLIESISIIN